MFDLARVSGFSDVDRSVGKNVNQNGLNYPTMQGCPRLDSVRVWPPAGNVKLDGRKSTRRTDASDYWTARMPPLVEESLY
jgi:hypothetical protein